MANIAFGGTGDASEVFAIVNRQYLQDIDVLVQQAVRRDQDRSDAEDRDMYSRYTKGEISDEEWLDYIRGRAAETVSEPEEHQKWTEMIREFETAIADNKAEFAFANGETTIWQLVNYYQQRAGELDKDSKAYRDLVLKINGYIDQGMGDDINTGAQAIADKIAYGQATIHDLIAFYRNKLKELRPNSDLRKQIENEIHQLTQQAGNARGGGGGGRGGGGGGRGGMSASAAYNAATSSGFIPRDPLTAARSNAGVSLSAQQFGGVLAGLSEEDTNDVLMGMSTHYETLTRLLASGEGIVVDPYTGQEIEATPDNLRRYAYNWIDSLEMEAISRETGHDTDASVTATKRAGIGAVIAEFLAPINTEEFMQDQATFFSAMQDDFEATNELSDPYAFQQWASRWAAKTNQLAVKTQNNVTYSSKAVIREGEDEGDFYHRQVQTKTVTPKPGYERLTQEGIDYVANTANILSAIATGDVDTINDAWTSAGDNAPGFMIGNEGAAAWGTVYGQTIMDIETGAQVWIYDEAYKLSNPRSNGLKPVPVIRQVSPQFAPDETGTQAVPVGANIQNIPAIDFGEGQELVKVIVDVRGRPTEVDAVATHRAPPNMWVLQTTEEWEGFGSDAIINDYTSLTPSQVTQALADGTLVRKPAPGWLSLVTVENGEQITRYRDPTTKRWVTNPAGQFAHMNGMWIGAGAGRVFVSAVDQAGGYVGTRQPYGMRGEPVPYFGNNPRKLQQMIDDGTITLPPTYLVGADGLLQKDDEGVPVPVGYSKWYHDDALMGEQFDDSAPHRTTDRRSPAYTSGGGKKFNKIMSWASNEVAEARRQQQLQHLQREYDDSRRPTGATPQTINVMKQFGVKSGVLDDKQGATSSGGRSRTSLPDVVRPSITETVANRPTSAPSLPVISLKPTNVPKPTSPVSLPSVKAPTVYPLREGGTGVNRPPTTVAPAPAPLPKSVTRGRTIE